MENFWLYAENTDWKNIEMTAYVMGDFGSLLCWDVMVPSFDTQNMLISCANNIGTAYKTTISLYNEDWRFLRRTYNSNSQEKEKEIGDEKPPVLSAERYLGVKFVVNNLDGNRIKMELGQN